ncbi:MAG: PilZ domain-containing protein [Acidobacteriaceae bacterium]|nr:PilZ domain-containing protein [Acidobacteriaceae bacterium]
MLTGQTSHQAIGAALLVSRDNIASAQIGDLFREHALSVEVSFDISTALDRLSRRKFEAVVIDSSAESQVPVLQRIRASASNRTAVTFALTNDRESTARALTDGFGFVLERPLTPDAISHTLRVAYGMIVRERRRYFRCPVSVPVLFSRKAAAESFGRTVNVSESGMALRTATRLEPGWEGSTRFTLPDLLHEMMADCRVCWSRENGEAGLSFLFLPSNLASELQAWLTEKLEKQLPESVAEKFYAKTRDSR